MKNIYYYYFYYYIIIIKKYLPRGGFQWILYIFNRLKIFNDIKHINQYFFFPISTLSIFSLINVEEKLWYEQQDACKI